jgi:hypothetical protein
MKNIYNVRYGMLLGPKDQWRIMAENEDGEQKWLSAPKKFNPSSNILETYSGSLYDIQSYAMDKNEFIKQINSDISRGHYEIF